MSKDDRPTITQRDDDDPSTASVLDPKLCVEVIRSDGDREYVSIPDAIEIYERRRDEAMEEVDHCEKRIEELRAKWNRSVKGRILRSGTSIASTGAVDASARTEEDLDELEEEGN